MDWPETNENRLNGHNTLPIEITNNAKGLTVGFVILRIFSLGGCTVSVHIIDYSYGELVETVSNISSPLPINLLLEIIVANQLINAHSTDSQDLKRVRASTKALGFILLNQRISRMRGIN